MVASTDWIKIKAESVIEFPFLLANEKILNLQEQFQEQFSDSDAMANKIRLFQNKLKCNAENLPISFSWEFLSLADGRLKRQE